MSDRRIDIVVEHLRADGWEPSDDGSDEGSLEKMAAELLEALDKELPETKPTAWQRLDKLRHALDRIAKSPHCAYDGPKHQGGDDRQYEIGVADGHRCAARDAQIALEADDALVEKLK